MRDDMEKKEHTNDGSASKEKLTIGKRIRKSLFSGSKEDIKNSFVEDILFPSIRDFIVDSIYNTVDTLIFGRDGGGGYRGRARWRSGSRSATREGDRYIDGPTKYARDSRSAREHGRSRTSSRYIFENVVFHDTDRMSAIEKADRVRDALLEELYKSGSVTVYYFYDEAELTGEFTDQEWGWKDFGPNNDIGFLPTSDGISLILPEPVYLGR